MATQKQASKPKSAARPADMPISESSIQAPPTVHTEMPNPEKLLLESEAAPAITDGLNIFPFDWRVETPRLMEIYESARDPGWSPSKLPWDSLKAEDYTLDQRYAIAYWWSLLSVFDASGPAVFARAMIHAYEVHEEDAIRKCFFSVTRDEMNHEEVCGRAINKMTPNGPLGYEPETILGKLARNNVEWLYHNGARYWNGYKKAVSYYPMPILFSSFLFGEVASSTLFHSMYESTDIPVFKEAFKNIGRDEGRHLSFCLALLKEILPKVSEEDKMVITKQFRAGFVFLSGILFEPPADFWQLPDTFLPAQRLLEEKAREAGFGVLTLEKRRENWRTAVVRLKTVVEPYGVKFPALPEIDVDGEDVAFDADKIVPIFLGMVRPRADNYEERRQGILDGAAAMFAERGFDGTSIANIAQYLGVSKALLYHYYHSKEALLYDILHSHCQLLVETASGAVAGEGRAEEQLQSLVRALMSLYVSSRDKHVVLLNNLHCLPGEQQKQIKVLEKRVIDVIKDLLAELRPDLSQPTRTSLAMYLMGAVNWTYTWFKTQGPVSESEFADLATSTFLNGVYGKPSASR